VTYLKAQMVALFLRRFFIGVVIEQNTACTTGTDRKRADINALPTESITASHSDLR
jgi:hypothetical protein|tara:strand:- start:519 stop:686 length:168 start_codon:yes stop_codon:yes gene_type:complete